MDTNPFIAAGTRAVDDVATRQDPAFSPQAVFRPALVRQTTVKTAA